MKNCLKCGQEYGERILRGQDLGGAGQGNIEYLGVYQKKR